MDTVHTNLNAIETFALIYYLNCYNAKVSEKYAALSSYMHSIYENNLQYNLNLLIDKTVEQTKALKKFKRDIKPFFSVDIVEINHLLGYKFANKYYSLISEKKLGLQIEDLCDYPSMQINIRRQIKIHFLIFF
jgi:hypothetical protein